MHEYTVEILYHFNCGICKSWWSYATTPSVINEAMIGLPTKVEFYCPHCGADEKVKIKDGFVNETT